MLEIKNLYKTYTSKNGVSYRALENVSLSFDDHGMCFVLGKSGSGKSTLLNMIGGLDKFDRGEIIFGNNHFVDFDESQFEYYRNHCVGFVFQDFCLLDSLNVFDNVAMSLSLQGKNDINKVNDVLKQVGIYEIRNKKTNELTGGQKQKVAIARAIIKKPNIILADEPTGSLDSENSLEVMKLLKEFSKDTLVIIVTHNKDLAYEYADRIIEIRDGFILKDMARTSFSKIENDENMMYSSTLLVAKRGNKINKDDIKEINNIILEKRQDYYLYISNDKNRVVSIYPNLKEIFSHRKREEDFVPYKYVNDNKNVDVLKKADGLKINKAIKFGQTLTKKRFSKFLLSIIISVISILVIGVLANFSTYDFSSATVTLLNKENMKYLNVTSSFTVSDSEYKLSENDFIKVDELNLPYVKNYDFKNMYFYNALMIGGSYRSDSEFNGSLDGFTILDDFDTYGLSIEKEIAYEQRNDEQKDKGIYISKLIADKMIKYGRNINSYDDVLSKKAKIMNVYWHIVGIYSSNDKFFNKRIITTADCMENFFDEIYRVEDILTASTLKSSNIAAVSSDLVIDVEEIRSKTTCNIIYFNQNISSPYGLKDNQIIVGREMLTSITGYKYTDANKDKIETQVANYNDGHHTLTIKTKATSSTSMEEIYTSINDVEIVGVITKYDGSSLYSGIYLQHNAFKNVILGMYKPTSILLSLENTNDFNGLVKKLNNNGFIITSHFAKYVLEIANIIGKFQSLFDIALVIWIFVVGVLFYSFMSKSIKDSKRTIGILKALGIKGYDIYKIFIIEALTLGIISTLIALAIFIIGGNLINLLITKYFYSFYMPMFIINPTIIIMMVIMPFVALFVSLIVPISRANSIKPIEVMNRE